MIYNLVPRTKFRTLHDLTLYLCFTGFIKQVGKGMSGKRQTKHVVQKIRID